MRRLTLFLFILLSGCTVTVQTEYTDLHYQDGNVIFGIKTEIQVPIEQVVPIQPSENEYEVKYQELPYY